MTSVTVQSTTKSNLVKQTEAKPPPATATSNPTATNTVTSQMDDSLSPDKYAQFKQDKEREDFTQRLIEFHKHKNVNTPLTSWPTLNGRSIDLFKLFTKVVSLGGWELVCEKDKWNEIGEYLDKSLLSACTNGAHALRLIYIRYLSMFEKFSQSLSSSNTSLASVLNDSTLFHSALSSFQAASTSLQQMNSSASMLSMSGSMGSTLKDLKGMLDDKSDELALISKRKFSYLIESTAMIYNYNQHHLHDVSSTSKLTFNPYEKLEISLLSGLPNEVDFVFNTILLLSSDEYHSFRIYSSPNLLNLMLAHVGFFGSNETGSTNYRRLYDTVWNAGPICRRNFVKFWHSAIQPPVQQDDDCYDDNYDSSNLTKIITSLLPDLYNSYLKTLPAKELLNLDQETNAHESKLVHTNHADSVEFRRIEQVMVTLNNLSFEENNADFMANKSPILIEFLVMCIYCTGSRVELKKHALDILSNLSRRIKLKSFSDKQQRLLLMSISHLIVGTNTNKIDDENPVKEFYDEQNQDRSDIIKGLEILTKLCAQQIDPCLTSVDYANETILAQYYLNEMTGALFLNKILVRLEQLLTVQDVFLLINTLECLYHMSQFNEAICNLIVSYTPGLNASPKLVSMLVNFLTVDMTHFGLPSDTKAARTASQNMKIYKVCNSNNIVTPNQTNHHIPNGLPQQQQSIVINNNANLNNNNNNSPNNKVPNQNNLTSLLQQTLNNQHQLNTTTTNGNNNTVSALLSSKVLHSNSSPNLQTNSNNTNNTAQRISTTSSTSTGTSQEQQAKNILCNWLRTCFQMDANSEISKTKLYPYYQQIAKMNNWNVLTIPTFFEILNATFPNLRYNDATNQIVGLKLAVNVKQQLQLKKEELIQQSEVDWPALPSNVNNVKIKATGPLINTTPLATSAATTKTVNGHTIETDNKQENVKKTESDNTNILPANKLPTALTTINVITPSILPLLTPPTPPPQPGTQTDENLNNNLTNGTANLLSTSSKQNSKLLNDTSNVKIEANEQQTTGLVEKKFEKILSKTDDQVLNNLERKLNENNVKTTNGLIEHTNNKLTNGNMNSDEKPTLTNGSKNHLTNGHANNHSCSSSESSVSSGEEEEPEEESKMNEDDVDDDDGQIESFRKRKHDLNDLKILVNNNKNESKSDEKDSNETEKETKKEEKTEITQNSDSPSKKQKTELTNQEEPSNNNNDLTKSEEENKTKSSTIANEQINITPVNITISASNAPTPVSNVPTPPPSSTLTPIPTPSPAPVPGGDYVCEWNNCKMTFNSVKSIYNHVCKYHLLNTDAQVNSNGSLCLWIGCDQIRRQKWSLVNHIQERHCNENALKCAIMYRQRGLVPVSSTSNQALLNYAKDAAFIAIQKNQRKSLEEFISTEEGPVSKTIRLLSALTLRNLARNSDKAKSIIKSHESVLTDIAFDLLESSNVLASCLWHLSN